MMAEFDEDGAPRREGAHPGFEGGRRGIVWPTSSAFRTAACVEATPVGRNDRYDSGQRIASVRTNGRNWRNLRPSAEARFLRFPAFHRYEFERQQRVDSGRLAAGRSGRARRRSEPSAILAVRRANGKGREADQQSLDKQALCSYYVLSIAMENTLVRSPRTRPDPARRSLARSPEDDPSIEAQLLDVYWWP